jgi:hypothetical protein
MDEGQRETVPQILARLDAGANDGPLPTSRSLQANAVPPGEPARAFMFDAQGQLTTDQSLAVDVFFEIPRGVPGIK